MIARKWGLRDEKKPMGVREILKDDRRQSSLKGGRLHRRGTAKEPGKSKQQVHGVKRDRNEIE